MRTKQFVERCVIEYTVTTPSGPSVVYLPLERLDVHADIVDVSTTAKYVFPVPARAAVCGFEMHTEDGRTVKAVAKEKNTAKKEHDEAIAQGKLTGLVEHVQDDVFTVSLGCLPPQQLITTKLTYVMDLMDDEQVDQVRLQLPVCIGQRFGVVPAGMTGASSIPPERVRISSEVYMRGTIQSITSPSHAIDALIEGSTPSADSHSNDRAVRYASPDFLDEDFVLIVKADGLDAARCFAERGLDGSVALQLTVTPHAKLPPIASQEYIFLVDRSGSMDGDRIDTAKRALVMLLRALPRNGTSFNIFSFGSTCDSLWPESMAYNEETLATATEHVDGMGATYGGTDIRAALQQVFESRNAQLPSSCFLLTDGEAWDTQGTLAMVKQAATNAKSEAPLRVFTLGIGATTSTEMCEGISRASNGVCLMAVSAESIVGKCSKLVKASRSEILRDVAIEWGAQVDPRGKSTDLQNVVLRQGPETTPLIYDGIRFVVFALVNDPKYTIPTEVTVRTKRVGTGEIFEFSVPVEQLNRHSATSPQRPMIHSLAARRIIMDLEDQERDNVNAQTKSAIIHLGEQYQLASRFTSFIAIEDENQEKLDIVREFAVLQQANDVPQSRGKKRQRQTARKSSGGMAPRKALQVAAARRVSSYLDVEADADGDMDVNMSAPPAGAGVASRTRARTKQTDRKAGLAARRTPATPTQKVTPSEDKVTTLIREQSFDGSFPATQVIKSILGINAVDKSSSVGVTEIVWVTILAIAYLQKHLIDQPELLDALVEKAKEFVGESTKLEFEPLLAQAVQLV